MNIVEAREAVQAFRRSALNGGFSELLKAAEALLARMEAIHEILDGTSWDSNTPESIADVLTDFGMTIQSPDEEDEDKEEAA
jgi:hypothetical protein